MRKEPKTPASESMLGYIESVDRLGRVVPGLPVGVVVDDADTRRTGPGRRSVHIGAMVMPFQPITVSAIGSSKSVNSLSTLIVATCCALPSQPP